MVSLRKHPFLLALRRWGRFEGEKRGETDVFAGYSVVKFIAFVCYRIVAPVGISPRRRNPEEAL